MKSLQVLVTGALTTETNERRRQAALRAARLRAAIYRLKARERK